MLAGIRNAVAGLQANDRQMDILGARLGSEETVPFPEVLNPTGASTVLPLSLSQGRDDKEKTAVPLNQEAPSQLPGVLPAGITSALSAGEPARDMGLYLIAHVAYRMNARVFSAAGQELKVLTRLGQ